MKKKSIVLTLITVLAVVLTFVFLRAYVLPSEELTSTDTLDGMQSPASPDSQAREIAFENEIYRAEFSQLGFWMQILTCYSN